MPLAGFLLALLGGCFFFQAQHHMDVACQPSLLEHSEGLNVTLSHESLNDPCQCSLLVILLGDCHVVAKLGHAALSMDTGTLGPTPQE